MNQRPRARWLGSTRAASEAPALDPHPTPRPHRAPLALLAALVAWFAAVAGAQHAAEPGTAPPPPAGDARIVVQVVNADGADDVGGLDVALYSLGADGRPGFTSGQTDAAGRISFPNLSNAPELVYLIGTHYRDVPFGQRLVFEAGQQEATVSLEVSAPTQRTEGVRLEELRVRVDWQGDRVLVREILRLVNPGAKVIRLPEDGGAEPGRAIVTRTLPPDAGDFEPGARSMGDGLALTNGVLRYRGPLYPREQAVEYQYTLPLASDARRLALPIELDRAAARVVAIAGTAGIAIEGAGLVASSEVESDSGEALAAWARGPLAAHERTALAVVLPEVRSGGALVAIPRADVWLDLDDTRLSATADFQLEVAPGAPVAGTPAAPLLTFTLPDGAELTGVSPETERLGLIPRERGFDVVGPIPAGTSRVGYAYRLASQPEGVELALRFPRAVSTLNVLVADTGLALESRRLHRLRAFRSGTRNYLHREAFNVEPGETVDLRITPLRARGLPREAGALLAVASVVGAAAFVVAPLIRRTRTEEPVAEPASSEALAQLRAEREATYAAILDLDHDFETGKLEADDHRQMREALRARAIELLAAERTAGAPATAAASTQAGTTTAAEPRAGTIGSTAATTAPATGFCPQCGAERDASWRFCARCGAALPAAPEPGA